ncbi:MAG: hypothetical protein PHG73_10935, partial [Pygmaiobacter sp.]|nr:hypothetical protein [Pygmaiobacter sp.]
MLFSKPAHRVRFAFKFVSFAKKKCPARLLPQRTGHFCLLFFNGSSIDNLFFILGQNKKAPLTGASDCRQNTVWDLSPGGVFSNNFLAENKMNEKGGRKAGLRLEPG